MTKRIIKLTETDLHNMVIEAIQSMENFDQINEEEVDEATASGVAGSGLPGEYTAPLFGDKDTLDRTPGNTCGMHDRV